jgi:hypothetical protein
MTIVRTFDRARGQMLVGFSGRAGAGKDTCAELLVRNGFRAVAFADALRQEVAESWRIDSRMLTDRSTKEWAIPALAVANCSEPTFIIAMELLGHDLQAPRSARWILQRWGTEYRRAVDSGYWVARGLQRIGRLRASGCHRICITDVRFANEAETVQSLGGEVVQVARPDLPALEVEAASHASEQALKCSAVVHNDGDREHLYAELLRVLDALGWKPQEVSA